MKYIFFYLLVVCGLFFSCDKKEFTDMSVSSDVSTSTEENRAIAKSSQAYLFAQKQLGIAPSGWTNVKNGKAVALYKRDQGSTVYVTELDLSRGAVLTSYYQYKDKNISAATQKTPSPSFVANPVSKFSDKMTKYGWFMVCNLNFFGNGYQSAHILKKGGTIVTCGYAGYKEKSFSKRYLNIYSSYATIEDGPSANTTVVSNSDLYKSTASFYSAYNVMGGLYPLKSDSEYNYSSAFGADKRAEANIGRTMVGIKSRYSGANKSLVYVLVAESLTQDAAYLILKTEFKVDQVIMFDGSGSSQMVTQDSSYSLSGDERNVATYLVVKDSK